MNARGAYDLHISREGIVRDRADSGTRPTGPVLGRLVKEGSRNWRAFVGEKDLGVSDSRYRAVSKVYYHHRGMA